MSIDTTISAATEAVPAVTPAQLHAGFGAANRASMECPADWEARTRELLSQRFGPATTAAILARVEALERLLTSERHHGAYDGPAGACNVLPSLFHAAAVAPLRGGRFVRAELEAQIETGSNLLRGQR